ncbi:MAG: Lcl C-terminal domain-containing protein, partial [Planctomycetota bacterium]
IDAQYWSSTQYLGTTMNGNATVFGFNFADGRIKGYPRDIGPRGQPMEQFVRYVRGNSDYGVNNFVDNGDGTITDNSTGLMWSQSDSGEGMDWEDALAWVQQRNEENYLGYNDWRLPNAKELQSIVDYTCSPATTNSAAIAPVFEISSIIDERGETNYPFYWTGTTHVSTAIGGDAAVYIAFGKALGYWMNSWMDVHGAGAQRSDPKSGNSGDYPQGRGPQGDAIRINNFVRCVRDAI